MSKRCILAADGVGSGSDGSCKGLPPAFGLAEGLAEVLAKWRAPEALESVDFAAVHDLELVWAVTRLEPVLAFAARFHEEASWELVNRDLNACSGQQEPAGL